MSLEEFCKIRYDNGDVWQQLKKDFAVEEQFKELFPNATVNIVSGNPNYGEVNSKGEHGMKTWQHRKD